MHDSLCIAPFDTTKRSVKEEVWKTTIENLNFQKMCYNAMAWNQNFDAASLIVNEYKWRDYNRFGFGWAVWSRILCWSINSERSFQIIHYSCALFEVEFVLQMLDKYQPLHYFLLKCCHCFFLLKISRYPKARCERVYRLSIAIQNQSLSLNYLIVNL